MPMFDEVEISPGYGLLEILEQWSLVVADFQQFYGVDVESGVLERRSWRWFRDLLAGLLTLPPTIVALPGGGLLELHRSRVAHHLVGVRVEE